jgi:alanine racemase
MSYTTITSNKASFSRKTVALVNLTCLTDNYLKINDFAPNSTTIAVIKANAYGHGDVEVAKALEGTADMLAVAFIDEAVKLRQQGIIQPILILEGAMQASDIKTSVENDFLLMFHHDEQLSWLTTYQNQHKRVIKQLWLGLDTGMHRLGFSPDNIDNVVEHIKKNVNLSEMVLCSHFSSADERENAKTTKQIEKVEKTAKKHGCLMSIANSAGILTWPESHLDYNRLGLALYGATPVAETALPFKLKAVMTLQSNIIAIRQVSIGETVGYGETWVAKRPSLIATVAIGYADGYPRNAPMNTPTYINGSIAPLAGRVSMDMITVDVTELDNVQIGDDVELWGMHLSVETIAEHVGAINYELITRVSERVPRVYIK